MKKGFTLIELLAVIVILAIIALIAVPIILGIIKDSKEEARERSIDNIIHTARIYAAKEGLEENEAVHIKDIKNMIDGEKPENGTIYFDKKGEVAFSLDFKDEVYVKSFEGEVEKEDQVYYIKVATTENIETKPFLEGPITKQQIEKIVTVPANKVPSDVLGSWDVSEQENGKIMAWYEDLDNNGLYEVYIGQEGGVKANLDSTKLFNYLINVKEINVTYLDTEYVTDMKALFQHCHNLERIIGLENFSTSKVTNMQHMFCYCFTLKKLDLTSFDTSNVLNMTSMFCVCKNLIELDIHNFNTSNVTLMKQMFFGCVSLIEIDVSNFDTSNVTNMGLMFGSAKPNDLDFFPGYMKLERIIGLETFNTSKVTDMSSMFRHCKFLITLDLRNFNTSKVTDMTSMFYGTINLKPIYIGSNWKTASTNTDMFTNSKTENESQLVLK